MATSKNAKLQFESGQTLVDYAAMSDSGDHKIHTISGGDVWSGRSGFEASVRPNGIVTGRNLITTHATDDTINYAGFTAYSEGTLYTVVAGNDTITRPSGDVAKINSITMTDAGAIAIVAGTDSDDTSFSTTRDAKGGPPYIPADSVELGQVRVTTQAAAAIASSEIFQVVGTHTERFDFPVWEENNIGDGDSAETADQKNAYIEFASELDPIHTGDAYKQVYISYNTPVFADVSKALDFVPCEKSHSVSSTQYYDGVAGAVSSSLGQGAFTAIMSDNITDALVTAKDEILTFKFFSDRNKTPYILTQGTLGLGRTFPAADQNQVSATITSESASAEFAS